MKSSNDGKSITAKKVLSIAGIAVCALIILTFILGIIFELAAPDSAFALWSKENIWDVTTLPSSWQAHQKTVINCLLLIAVIFALSKILRLVFKKIMQKTKQMKKIRIICK